MNYCEIKLCDISNGIGVRTSVFVSGCETRCAGCFNAEAWPFDAGNTFTDVVLAEVLDSLSPDYMDGLSILGGEPLHPRNLFDVGRIIDAFRCRYHDRKSVWLWTGYQYEELTEEQRSVAHMADVLVDGPYVHTLRNPMLRFRGSSNQRIIDVRRTVEAGQAVPWTDHAPYATHGWAVSPHD